jgi:hypothetical protein
LKIGNCRKIIPEKIEFEYYIFNVFLIAAKCTLLNNSASFQYFSFKIGQIVELVLRPKQTRRDSAMQREFSVFKNKTVNR